MRLYFHGLLPLLDLGRDHYQPYCRKCSHTPFDRATLVFEDCVTYQEGVIYWQCSKCESMNVYKMTNDGIKTINRIYDHSKDYTLCAVVAKVQTSNDNIDYHAWRVKIYRPRLDGSQKRGYSALRCQYKGYVNDSPSNDGQFEIIDGHNQRSSPDLKLAISLVLNARLGFYEEPCEGCGTILEVSPSWKHSYDPYSEPPYCDKCRCRLME